MVFLEILEVSVGDEIGTVRPMELRPLEPVSVSLRWADSLGPSSHADRLVDVVPRYDRIDRARCHAVVGHVGCECRGG